MQGSRVSCLAQTGLATFSKGVQFISVLKSTNVTDLTHQEVYLSPHCDKQPHLGSGDRLGGIAHLTAPMECLLRTPSSYGVGTGGSQRALTANKA